MKQIPTNHLPILICYQPIKPDNPVNLPIHPMLPSIDFNSTQSSRPVLTPHHPI
jgi:hypothetical protein